MKAPDPAGMAQGGAADAGEPPEVEMSAPAGWTVQPRDQAFYLGKWALPGGGVATLSWLGPDASTAFIVQNVERWTAEWTTPAGEPVLDYRFGRETNGGRTMHRLELEGTLTGVRQLGGGEPRAGWALHGAVIETPRGPLFFKLIGPREEVAAQRDAAWAALGALVVR